MWFRLISRHTLEKNTKRSFSCSILKQHKWHGSNFKGEKTHGKVAHNSLCSLPSALMSQAAGVAMASVILPVLLNEYICLCLGVSAPPTPTPGLVRTLNGSSLR